MSYHGIVKEVRSGDTLTLFGPANKIPAPEFSITLSGILAPRLGRKEGTDEPFAWAAREFLRTRYVGKKVSFRIDSEWNGREFGSVYDEQGNNIAMGLVAAGLVRVKDKGQGQEFEDMQTLQAEAAGSGRGLHSEDTHLMSSAVRIVTDTDFDTEEFAAEHRGRAVHGIVERVRDGGCVSVYVLPEFQYLNLFLSGISAPRALRDQETGEIEYQAFYGEAKYVVESLLLQRDVMFYIDQVDKNGNCYGTVVAQEGNIAEELLRRGLAKTVDWSCELSIQKAGMRLAERGARESLTGIWKDYVPPANANRKATGDTSFPARVVEVRSGDTLVIQRQGAKELTTVSLASIRCPRLGNRQRQEDDAPWAFEAKEMVRSAVIGQNVQVKVDYIRLVGESERPFVSINNKGKNVQTTLARAGLCETLRHRGDEDRASIYDQIAEAEQEAKDKKTRLHGEGGAPVHRFNDHSGSAQKAKAFLPHLQRYGKVRAIVDYVANGARARLTLPDNSAAISFGIAGVTCPKTARGDEAGEEYGDEAAFFTKLHVLQREVEIEVEAADRGGSFLGSMWVNGESLAVQLLQNGYAYCSDSAKWSPYAQQLEAAEATAKNGKVRVWAKYDAAAEERKRQEQAASDERMRNTPLVIRVVPQHVVNGNTFFTHLKGDEAEPLRQRRAQEFAQCDFGPPGPGGRYRQGQYCSAEWDGDMYRARVLRHDSGKYEVSYIDYGNVAWLSGDAMQPWSADKTQPPLAFECKLAYVRAPGLDDDFGYDAGSFLNSTIVEKDLTAQVVAKSGDVLHLMLFNGDSCVNGEALKSGYTTLSKDAKRNPNPSKELKQLMAAVEQAKRARINIWRYGDPESDDEDQPRRGAWGR